MNRVIKRNLEDQEGNYILPFFWQHGESEEVLRQYMKAIYDCGIRSVCVESRPHPDFAGPGWWRDMDVILDEARKREMKVWILDDSHFPTGYANGALKDAPEERCRQSIVCMSTEAEAPEDGTEIRLDLEAYMHPEHKKTTAEEYMLGDMDKWRKFEDDRILSVTAYGGYCGQAVPLEGFVVDNMLSWKAPEGAWRIHICVLTRNLGPHRNYINMMDRASCRVLLDAVYEPHFEHYGEDFGKTIAGFFSDEPELGNGHLYAQGNVLGSDQDLPWSSELEQALTDRLGSDFGKWMPLLWDKTLSSENRKTEAAEDGRTKAAEDKKAKASEDRRVKAAERMSARVRYAYMDAVTRLVEEDFSKQIGQWCREHGVEYIGHLIEDNNQHARTGSSLGHFFRGMSGQDMAGIDDIGGQVLPQGEDLDICSPFGQKRDGEFYHYVLGKLGASYGAIDPLKKGRTMCEIFGAYGWSEGVRLEKYLADHFMVRGVNRFVPHAFTGREYPDPDCPPHFYAHGNHPQYRHFGCLMRYMNRVCGLIDGGCRTASAAILYHGEAEWTGRYMLMQKPARLLADRQIDYDFIPSDVFEETERYRTSLGERLTVNTQEYRILIIPETQFISGAAARAAAELSKKGFPVVFLNALPEGIYDGDDRLIRELAQCKVLKLEELVPYLDSLGIPEIYVTPADNRIRCLHYINDGDIYYFVNEGTKTYRGELALPSKGSCYQYDAWENKIYKVLAGTRIRAEIEPGKSLIIIFGDTDGIQPADRVRAEGKEVPLKDGWKRSICRSIDYPAFSQEKEVSLPDSLAFEKPGFSGFVRYENSFMTEKNEKVRDGKEKNIDQKEMGAVLEISDAAEGVEVFVNGVSAGIQISAPYRYDISDLIKEGKNTIAVEVATTLEREVFALTGPGMMGPKEPSALSGITGEVRLWLTVS